MKLPLQSRAWAGLAAAGMLVASTVVLPACEAGPAEYGIEYPPNLKQGATLDIQVVRRGQRVTMTNTTAINFGPSRLWLNRRFSRPIEEWHIGQTLELHLATFADEFGERFRPGGFFAAEAPDRIVQAQIYTLQGERADERMYGLVVVSSED